MKNDNKEKYHGIVKIMSISIVMAMLAYTAHLCLVKSNKYHCSGKCKCLVEEKTRAK